MIGQLSQGRQVEVGKKDQIRFFGQDPIDPAVLALSAIFILLLAIAASIIPARRAASVEPMEALRSE